MSSSRNARPLSTRSVLVSVLLGSDPPWLPASALVRTTQLFGVAESATRTALSRMASAGEAEAVDGGYRLTGRLVERQQRQMASRRAAVRRWDGTWELATVKASRRAAADRAELRTTMTTRRLAELREGVWGRPDNLDGDRSPDAAALVDRWCTTWAGARPTSAVRADRLWDLDGWARAAEGLEADMKAVLPALLDDDPSALADGFVVSAAVLRLLQADPLLPDELLPATWPGPSLRAEYDRYDAAYRALLRSWLRA